MKEIKCPDCHSIMAVEMMEDEVINGESRRVVEYKCTNPVCGTVHVDNFPI